MNYSDAIVDELSRYIPVAGWSSNVLGLKRIFALLSLLGDPQRDLKVVHVGGTSGKGSTAAICASILNYHGLRVGLHLSPHVQDIREAWQLNGQFIDGDRVLRVLGGPVRAAALRVAGDLGELPSYFEVKVATAFSLFEELGVDVAVVEVGLGGKLDGTNVFSRSIPIVTNVGLDHTEILGDTVELIASDKAMIIKKNSSALSGARQASVREILTARALETGSTIEFFDWETHSDEEINTRLGLRISDILPEKGVERQNAILGAAAAGKVLKLDREASWKALQAVHLPGRVELVTGTPDVVVDGAHNPDKMEATSSWIGTKLAGRSVIGLLAFKDGKDLAGCLARLTPRLDAVVVSTFDAGIWKCSDTATVARLVRAVGFAGMIFEESSPALALALARKLAADDGVVVATGSLYFAGTVRRLLAEEGVALPQGSFRPRIAADLDATPTREDR